jgi:Flp pilus assembly protein TadD
MLAYSLVVDHGNLAMANTLARRAVASAPADPGFQYVLGRVLDAQGDHDHAVTALEIAAKLIPDNVEYHVALAAACAAAGRSEEAVAERRRALELKFGHAG